MQASGAAIARARDRVLADLDGEAVLASAHRRVGWGQTIGSVGGVAVAVGEGGNSAELNSRGVILVVRTGGPETDRITFQSGHKASCIWHLAYSTQNITSKTVWVTTSDE